MHALVGEEIPAQEALHHQDVLEYIGRLRSNPWVTLGPRIDVTRLLVNNATAAPADSFGSTDQPLVGIGAILGAEPATLVEASELRTAPLTVPGRLGLTRLNEAAIATEELPGCLGLE